jgi:hypothetical integral membrane protein (TIGR02206 family)
VGGEVIFRNMARPPAGGWETFEPWSVTHAAVVVVFLLLVTGAVELGQRWRASRRGRRLEVTLAAGMFACWAGINIWLLLPSQFDPAHTLPLHVCDLASLIAPAALLTRWRPLRALLFYWGIGLTTQAFIMPQLSDGPARVGFYVFWLNHYIVVGAAIYDLAVSGFRPAWRDFGFAALASLAYLAIILPLDVAFGFNYGFVGKGGNGASRPTPAIVAALGPWPWRVAVIAGLVAATMALLTLPFELARGRFEASRRGSR